VAGVHVDAAPERHQGRHRSNDVAARANEGDGRMERLLRMVQVLDDVEKTRHVESGRRQIGDPEPKIVAMKVRARSPQGGDVEQRAVPVDPGEIVTGAGEHRRDAARAAAELDDAIPGRNRQTAKPTEDETVPRSVPEVLLFCAK
jgi:hypothetical protein